MFKTFGWNACNLTQKKWAQQPQLHSQHTTYSNINIM